MACFGPIFPTTNAPIYLAGIARPGPSRRDDLAVHAVARLLLHGRIDHIQASWVTQGPRIGQLSLRYGVNDFGSTMMEENVVSAAGCIFTVPLEEIERLITGAGYEPRRRNTRYEFVN